MKDHPLMGVHKHKLIDKPEVIVYMEHSGIGNLISSTPMLQAIRKAKPDARLYVVSWKRSCRIIEGLDCVDHVFEAENFGQNSLPEEIDHLLISPVGALGQLVSFLTPRSKHIHRYDVNPPPWTQHEVERKMLFARKLGYRGPIPDCKAPYFEYNRLHAILGIPYGINKCIAISAAYLKTDQWPMKHWGNKKYSELIKNIIKEYGDNDAYILVGSKEDSADAEEIISKIDVPVIKLDENCQYDLVINRCGFSNDIKDTAALLSGVVLSIGNDGGLQHIAAAVGKPTVTIFTFTNPVKNRPFNSRGKVVLVPCQDRLTCQHGKWQQCGPKGCLDVPMDSVFTAVKDVLKE